MTKIIETNLRHCATSRTNYSVTAKVLMGLMLCLAACAQAQNEFPNRSIRLIVPYTAGGNVDITARIISKKLSEQFNQQIIIENRPGASTIIGSQLVAKSPPDGYTLLLTGTITSAHTLNPSLFATLPYDTLKDFAPISAVTQLSLVLVTNPALPVKNVQELIALAKAKPKEINAATGGPGGSASLAVVLLMLNSGAEFTPVHYKGNAPGLADTVAGQTSMMIETPSTVLQHIKGGTLRALAITSKQRSPLLPDVPTIAESGYPGYDVTLKLGLLAPGGTPKPILNRLAAEIAKIAGDAATRKLFAEQGSELISSTPEDFTAEIEVDIIKWAEIIRKNGIKAD